MKGFLPERGTKAESTEGTKVPSSMGKKGEIAQEGRGKILRGRKHMKKKKKFTARQSGFWRGFDFIIRIGRRI